MLDSNMILKKQSKERVAVSSGWFVTRQKSVRNCASLGGRHIKTESLVLISGMPCPLRPECLFLHHFQSASGTLGDFPVQHERWYRSLYLVAGFWGICCYAWKRLLVLWMAFSVAGRIRGKLCAFLAAKVLTHTSLKTFFEIP